MSQVCDLSLGKCILGQLNLPLVLLKKMQDLLNMLQMLLIRATVNQDIIKKTPTHIFLTRELM